MESDALSPKEVSLKVQRQIDCAAGSVLRATWQAKEYLVCVMTKATGLTFITSIEGEFLHASVEYLAEKEAAEAMVQYLQPFPVIFDIFGHEQECPVLELARKEQEMNRRLSSASGSPRASWWSSSSSSSSRALSSLGFFTIDTTQPQLDSFAITIATNPMTNYATNIDNDLHQSTIIFRVMEETGIRSLWSVAQAGQVLERKHIQMRRRLRHEVRHNSEERRVSEGTAITITIPRACVFVHGSGYGYVSFSSSYSKDDTFEPGFNRSSNFKLKRRDLMATERNLFWSKPERAHVTGDGYNPEGSKWENRIKVAKDLSKVYEDKQSAVNLYPASLAFGFIHEFPPCYCQIVAFTALDTFNAEWYQETLQIEMVEALARGAPFSFYAEGSWNVERIDGGLVENTIIFTHYTASLTMGAALANGMFSLADSSRWVTLHTPLKGINELTNPGAELRSKLCTRANMERLVRVTNRDLRGDDNSLEKAFEEVMKEVIVAGISVESIFEACSPDSDSLIKTMKWVKQLNPLDFPDDVTKLYLNSIEQISNRVDAALCGSSAVSFLSTKTEWNKWAKKVGILDAVASH